MTLCLVMKHVCFKFHKIIPSDSEVMAWTRIFTDDQRLYHNMQIAAARFEKC